MRTFGRTLQQIGLVLPPLLIFCSLAGMFDFWERPFQMLLLLAAAVCMFSIGRIVEGYAVK